MNTEKRDFNKVAETWDEKPVRVNLAKDVAQSISELDILTPEMDIMDFGCGTGLLTTKLHPLVHSITGVDSSQGMLDVFDEKIAKLKLGNIKTLLVDLEKGDSLEGSYDLILSNMTIHHIKEIKPLLLQFYKILTPGGYLCISDLDTENGRFHGDNTGVFHFGFERPVLHKLFVEAGFDNVRDKLAAKVEKPGSNGEINRFTVFLMTGQKKTK